MNSYDGSSQLAIEFAFFFFQRNLQLCIVKNSCFFFYNQAAQGWFPQRCNNKRWRPC